MRSDDNIYCACFDAFGSFILLFTGAEPAKHMNVERITGEPLTERLKMLLCQNRCRNEYSHLFAFNSCFECSPNSHLGFSVTHIPTQ
ncbi:hypothetical protein D3C74_376760 [compost metagenome]